jgi:hypothetical protein
MRSPPPLGPSVFARWTSRIALFAVGLLAIALLLHRLVSLPSTIALTLVAVAFAGAALSILLAIAAAVGVWRSCSEQMHALCLLHDIRYFHFLQPNQYVEGSKELTAEERANGYAADSPYRPVVEVGYQCCSGSVRSSPASGCRSSI